MRIEFERAASELDVPRLMTGGPTPMTTRPPKPRLVFRVGVVGHRPDRLKSADLPRLAGTVRSVLTAIRREVETFGLTHASLFADVPPVLRAVSPLAEGADRLFAEQALDLGYELCCAMPFPQVEFEADFTSPHALEPDSRGRFRALLERADRGGVLTRFEMDGDRRSASEAYGACGHVVLNQSDLLIVVWDGERQGKRGGTEETFDEARRKGVPAVWIDARAPHAWQLVVASAATSFVGGARPAPIDGDDMPRLEDTVRQALNLPRVRGEANPGDGSERTLGIDSFLAERRRRVNPAPWWRIFRDLIGDGRWSVPSLRVQDYESAVESEWPRDASTPHARVVDRLRPFYAWPDQLAVAYSDIYRSAFVLAYLLAGIAVGMALLPLALGWDIFEPHLQETIFVFAELVLILSILVIVWRGRRRKWHERWIDYRLAAELLRHLRLSAPLGSMRPFPQVPAQWASYGDPASTWMAWYVRAVERDVGLPSARLDAHHIRACAKDLVAAIGGQVAFHQKNAHRSRRLEKRLHATGVTLLVATLVACGAHVVFGIGAIVACSPWILGSLTFAAGFLPALGAAVAGISNQGEFRRLVMRSEAMWSRLAELEKLANALLTKLATVPGGAWIPGASREASDLAGQAAQLMVTEVLDWRIVFLDRPLREP